MSLSLHLVVCPYSHPPLIFIEDARGCLQPCSNHPSTENRLMEPTTTLLAEGVRWWCLGPIGQPGGRPTAHWTPSTSCCSGGLPRVLWSLFHVPWLLISRFGTACGPFHSCEPDSYALIGRRFFPVDHNVLITCILAQFPTLHIF